METGSGHQVIRSGTHEVGDGHYLEARLREQFPDAIEAVAMTVDFPTFTVSRAQFLAVCRFAKEQLGFDSPQNVNGIDRLTHLEVVYHLYSMSEYRFLGLKVHVDRDDPHVPTATGIWRGVNWHEREVFDMFGVLFDDHPDLRRILLPDDWEGHPMRKDYTEID